jgi:NAD-dependent SIR2 family protein deacetylase
MDYNDIKNELNSLRNSLSVLTQNVDTLLESLGQPLGVVNAPVTRMKLRRGRKDSYRQMIHSGVHGNKTRKSA